MVYRKKYGWGTNWIGYRQYYSSVFMEPHRIEKANLPYYSPDSHPYQDEANTDKHCSFDADFESGNLHSVYKVCLG